MLAKTDASARLKRTEVTVSVEVGWVRLEIAALLYNHRHVQYPSGE